MIILDFKFNFEPQKYLRLSLFLLNQYIIDGFFSLKPVQEKKNQGERILEIFVRGRKELMEKNWIT